MLFLLVLLAVLVGYPTIGVIFAVLYRPRIIAGARYYKGDVINRKEPSRHWNVRDSDGIDRKAVHEQTQSLIYRWPVQAWQYALTLSTDRALDRVDPAVYERQQRIIARLEAEAEEESRMDARRIEEDTRRLESLRRDPESLRRDPSRRGLHR